MLSWSVFNIAVNICACIVSDIDIDIDIGSAMNQSSFSSERIDEVGLQSASHRRIREYITDRGI